MEQLKIGKYTVISEIGKGGMGVVYKAFDPTIGRTLAIKTIRFDEAGPQMAREEAQARFLREARSIGGLSHPNIVTVYEVGEDQGTSFIAMEYVEGSSLEDLLKKGKRFTPIEAVHLIIQLADALGHAHRRDIVHRDVKPANILIDQEGRPRLVDFGIARISTSTITLANTILGTPHYMSPEQITGKAVDCRADIFSVGAILYELLTSEKAFQGDQLSTIIYKIVNEEPHPLRSYVKDLPNGLNAIVHKALAKDPARRYQTCGDLIGDLNDYLRGAAPAPPRGLRAAAPPAAGETVRLSPADIPSGDAPGAGVAAAAPRKRLWLWGGLIAAVIGLAAAAFFLWKPSADEVHPAAPLEKYVAADNNVLPVSGKTETNAVTGEKEISVIRPDKKAQAAAAPAGKDVPAGPPITAAIRPPEKAKAPETAKVREDKTAGLAGLLASSRESYGKGEFQKAFDAAMSVLVSDPASVEAQELWTSASLRLAPLELKTSIDLFVQSFPDKTTSAYLQARCTPELFRRIEKDIERLFSQYKTFESTASDISITFANSPGSIDADLKFGLFVLGRAASSGTKRALIEGFYRWHLRKTGERWIITDIQFDSLKK